MKRMIRYRKPLFLDKLEGKAKVKNEADRLNKLCHKYFRKLKFKYGHHLDQVKIDWTESDQYLERAKPQDKEFLKLIRERSIESGSISFYGHSINGVEDAKKYVASISLVDALKTVSLDIRTTILPDNLHYYIEPTGMRDEDGHEVKFVCVKKIKVDEAVYLHLAIASQTPSGVIARQGGRIDLSNQSTMDDCLNGTQLSQPSVTKKDEYKFVEVSQKRLSIYKTILNLIVYINSSSADIVEIDTTPQPSWMPKSTQGPAPRGELYYLGNEFRKLYLKVESQCSVRGHFRWQPHGEGRGKVKLIYIKPHSRTLQTKIKAS